MKKKKESFFLGIMGIILTTIWIVVFIYWILHVNIGEWVSRESYNNPQDWMKQFGLFIGSMAGWYFLLDLPLELLNYLPKKKKQRGKKNV